MALLSRLPQHQDLAASGPPSRRQLGDIGELRVVAVIRDNQQPSQKQRSVSADAVLGMGLLVSYSVHPGCDFIRHSK